MSIIITDDCTSCAACEPECPNEAIREGEDIFIINPDLCTECVGFDNEPQCAAVCPVDCCVNDPNMVENEKILIERAIKLHPDEDFSGDYPSRYKK